MKTYSRKKPGESQEVIIDLNELCRLCMAKEDELVPIFNSDDPVPLTLRIMACVALEVFEGDGLPNKICHPCRYQLDKSYTFRKKCENSDLKLRQHLKELQEKLGTQDLSQLTTVALEEEGNKEDEGEASTTEATSEAMQLSEPSTEQDLLGVTQVAYIQPEPEPEDDPENITLPPEIEEGSKEACTLTTLTLKKELPTIDGDGMEQVQDEGEGETVFIMQNEDIDGNPTADALEEQDLEAIAEAVKNTLSQHPGLNTQGALQLKVEQNQGKPTQVQVTTADGSVIVMELMTEEEPEQPKETPQINIAEVNDEGELKIFQCPDCPKAFARRIQLRRHASVHMQQRGFSCGICEKWFPTRSAMIRHERIHTGERPFQCEVCQKSFAQKEILYRHLLTHTGRKPYVCPHCNKGFTQKEPLRIHLRTHLNPNPSDIQLHYCTLCPKVFCHASGLSRHLITHTGKTFKCRDCDKSFSDKSSLKRHHRQAMHQP